MNEEFFVVTKEGTTLQIELGPKLHATNAPALSEELSKYIGQDIEKIVFDATGLFYISSAGLRVVFFAYQRLGKQPVIEFVNCPKEIQTVLDQVGLTVAVKFVESEEKRRAFRRGHLTDAKPNELEEKAGLRRQTLDNFAANNDVVTQTMKLGQEE
jgi:anti-anti-sigma factor